MAHAKSGTYNDEEEVTSYLQGTDLIRKPHMPRALDFLLVLIYLTIAKQKDHRMHRCPACVSVCRSRRNVDSLRNNCEKVIVESKNLMNLETLDSHLLEHHIEKGLSVLV